MISLALAVTENGQLIVVSGIIPQGDSFSKKAKCVKKCLKVQCKHHNIDFISHKNINPRTHLNQDRLHQNKKRKYKMGAIILLLLIIFTFENLYLQHQQLCMNIVFLMVRTQMK